MLIRRSKLIHPIGTVIDTPCLVPSFSSKGFPIIKESGQLFSEVTKAMELTGPFITEMLISAYDIHHQLLLNPQQFFKNKKIVFIDSGAYELSREYDSTEPKQGPYKSRSFSLRDYWEVLVKLQKQDPIVISNFDWSSRWKPIEDQILEAQKLFNDFSHFLNNFIIKPSRRKKYLDINEVIRHVSKLRKFNIIGVTEKEIGTNLLSRLKNVAKLRVAMDRENVSAPIHIWGGLDPVITPLYFLAGAEIFDGVSWLRYVYYNGMAVYRNSYSVLELGIENSVDHVRSLVLTRNITFLRRLTTEMRLFVDSGCSDFNVFDKHGDKFKRAYATLRTELKGVI